MKKIYKYDLVDLQEFQRLTLPLNSAILTIQNQNESPVLWAIIDPNETEMKTISILTILTGEEMVINTFKYTYISTCQFDNGSYVCHYFIEC